MVKTGLDVLIDRQFDSLVGKRVGILCNQASISRNLIHCIDTLYPQWRNGIFTLKALFGPQHGIWGHTQANMIEWEGGTDRELNVPVFSLYGRFRKPTREMLQDVDVLVIDLQDVGARYYTYIWTVALCLEACMENGISVIILDRPNPICGTVVEGPLVQEKYRSFVGLYSIPARHGLTLGEIGRFLQANCFTSSKLSVVQMQGWKRDYYFEQTGLEWGVPSPNMPLPRTALVYPGMCLFEGTNVSEGRGTTRPFEIFGAPWINGRLLAKKLNSLDLPGVYFRNFEFRPTFDKYRYKNCSGCFLHVTDRHSFKPFLTSVSILAEIIKLYPKQFKWKSPPYEYEYRLKPFDILVGNGWIRPMLEQGASCTEMEKKWHEETQSFMTERSKYLLY